jgi:hypothetical protein
MQAGGSLIILRIVSRGLEVCSVSTAHRNYLHRGLLLCKEVPALAFLWQSRRAGSVSEERCPRELDNGIVANNSPSLSAFI